MAARNSVRCLVALICASALVVACAGGAGPLAARAITGSMFAELAGRPSPNWIASREANAAVDGDAIRIVGEDSLGRKITIRLYGIDLNSIDPNAEREYVVTSSSLFTVGFAQLYESGTAEAFSTGAAGGSGSIRITLASPTRIVGTFAFTGRPEHVTSSTVSDYRLVRQGTFDVGFK